MKKIVVIAVLFSIGLVLLSCKSKESKVPSSPSQEAKENSTDAVINSPESIDQSEGKEARELQVLDAKLTDGVKNTSIPENTKKESPVVDEKKPVNPIPATEEILTESKSVHESAKEIKEVVEKEDVLKIAANDNAIENNKQKQGIETEVSTSEQEVIQEEKVAEQVPVVEPLSTIQTIDFNKDWNIILSQNVDSQGNVNYEGIKKQSDRLEGYLAKVSNNPPKDSWSRNEKLAYWINIYNAYTVKLISDNYPLSSITDLEGGKPWDKKWIRIKGKTYSLNNIEHDIIRPRFNEPRIHFAVNCAAKSCPPLLNEAWSADKLEEQLETATKRFINNSKLNSFDKGKAEVSKIFEWYGADFKDLKAFLSKYAGKKVDDISFKEYNWSLNEK